MPYNWKCCSFYPNNFGASALFKRKRVRDASIYTSKKYRSSFYS